MLSLALRGKISITEDVVTAAVFDALAAGNDVGLWRRILATVQPGLPDIPDFDEIAVELWPKTAEGEPDVRVRLLRRATAVATIVVEAKLGAPKSGTGELLPTGTAGDQLARYLRGESKTETNVFLLYLTHHLLPPKSDLQESISWLHQCECGNLADRLLWTSWRSVERELAVPGSPDVYCKVRNLLRKVRMFWFDGISTASRVQLRSGPGFYYPQLRSYVWPQPPHRLSRHDTYVSDRHEHGNVHEKTRT